MGRPIQDGHTKKSMVLLLLVVRRAARKAACPLTGGCRRSGRVSATPQRTARRSECAPRPHSGVLTEASAHPYQLAGPSGRRPISAGVSRLARRWAPIGDPERGSVERAEGIARGAATDVVRDTVTDFIRMRSRVRRFCAARNTTADGFTAACRRPRRWGVRPLREGWRSTRRSLESHREEGLCFLAPAPIQP